MKIIPVIDIKNKQVVSARQGQRNSYQAIRSPLCSSSSIEDVLTGFLSLYPFKIIYIADINAITHTGNNQDLIDHIIFKHPDIDFWIDNGKKMDSFSKPDAINYKPVFGSEYQTPTIQTACLADSILSLDFFPEHGYKGPKQLIENSALWPQNIIIMTLDRVGRNTGPDFERLVSFQQQYPKKNFIAAGGIRNQGDLLKLKKMGVCYALVASALHSGTLNLNKSLER